VIARAKDSIFKSDGMGTRHEKLYSQYAKDLRVVKVAAERWWRSLLLAVEDKAKDAARAAQAVQLRWPAGAPSHPRVIAVLRKYWIECEELNRQLMEEDQQHGSKPDMEEEDEEGEEESPVPAKDFLTEFLLDGKNDKLAEFLFPLTYWPIGREEENESDDVAGAARRPSPSASDSPPGDEWQVRARALISAVRDLAIPNQPRANTKGSPSHRELFTSYVKRLRRHKTIADSWWNDLIEAQEESTGDRGQAIENVIARRPVGPASHPLVVGTVRKHWLEVAKLNQQSPEPSRVAPEEFVLEWLIQNRQHDLARTLASYPFWPLGMNVQGEWV